MNETTKTLEALREAAAWVAQENAESDSTQNLCELLRNICDRALATKKPEAEPEMRVCAHGETCAYKTGCVFTIPRTRAIRHYCSKLRLEIVCIPVAKPTPEERGD